MLYLLHAKIPVGGTGRNSASHYVGYTSNQNLQQRLGQHMTGAGSKLVAAMVRVPGQEVYLVRLWPEGTRKDERRLHRNGHLRRLCPLCNPALPLATGHGVLLRRLSLHSKKPLARLGGANGGVLPSGSPTGGATLSLRAQHQASGTAWTAGLEATAETLGGTATAAPARQRRASNG